MLGHTNYRRLRFTYAISFAALITAGAAEGAYLFCPTKESQAPALHRPGIQALTLYLVPQLLILVFNAMGVKVSRRRHHCSAMTYVFGSGTAGWRSSEAWSSWHSLLSSL